MAKSQQAKQSKLRLIPSVDEILRTSGANNLRESIGAKRLTTIARQVTSEMRSEMRAHPSKIVDSNIMDEAVRRLEEKCRLEKLSGLRHVINATGVVLHTNLGRAPLSEDARKAIVREASRYCTLEYDFASGTRGRRGARVEALLQQLTGSEDSLIVNNCASAALLILAVLARGGETIVSRGELVEIGGDFRVPDVMSNSGTVMVEVGTTNRTSLDDYRRAINSNTRLIMRVHPSNYRVVGFASTPSTAELAILADEANLPFYEDAGSGLLEVFNDELKDEPLISSLMAQGVDVVSFSGDKLLGAIQAGIITGKTDIIQKLRRHPLYRALRIDKLRLAALEATLVSYERGVAREEIPTVQMIHLSREKIGRRAQALINRLASRTIAMNLIDGYSTVGGGAGPTAHLPTVLIAITHPKLSAVQLETKLRAALPPVIARIADEKVLLDLRTVFPEEEPDLLGALIQLT
ncbi:MAG: L-seryl-tRNA(Sec) selenium transferase [Pyrinomonadaceae bacterium]